VLHGGVNLLDKVDELKARSVATKQEMEVGCFGGEEGVMAAPHGRTGGCWLCVQPVCWLALSLVSGARRSPQVRRRQQEEQQRRLQELQSHQADLSQAFNSLEVRSPARPRWG
jgi:hypothetical protein